jgi:hypothetical protein
MLGMFSSLGDGEMCGDGAQALLDGRGHVIAAAGRTPFAFEILQQLVIEGQDAAGVEGGFQRLRITLAGNVLEHFVDAVAPLEHGIVLAPRADEVRQRKLLGGQKSCRACVKATLNGSSLPRARRLRRNFPCSLTIRSLGALREPRGNSVMESITPMS